MAINALMVMWLGALRRNGAWAQGASMLELGPQELLPGAVSVDLLQAATQGSVQVDRHACEKLFADRQNTLGGARTLYSLLGIADYRSLDMAPGADIQADLNFPYRFDASYDVVTNFGTAEHCFNPGMVFYNIHNALKVGGCAVHVLPAYGDLNHGFYNIHPNLYFSLIEANGYEALDIRYVDDLSRRAGLTAAQPLGDLDLAFQLKDMIAESFPVRVEATFRHNGTRDDRPANGHRVMDYCFVCLRKATDAPFRFPYQL